MGNMPGPCETRAVPVLTAGECALLLVGDPLNVALLARR